MHWQSVQHEYTSQNTKYILKILFMRVKYKADQQRWHTVHTVSQANVAQITFDKQVNH
jgi:hypothetical protein